MGKGKIPVDALAAYDSWEGAHNQAYGVHSTCAVGDASEHGTNLVYDWQMREN